MEVLPCFFCAANIIIHQCVCVCVCVVENLKAENTKVFVVLRALGWA